MGRKESNQTNKTTKYYHQKMQTEMQTALILIRLLLFRPALLAQKKNYKVAAGCGSHGKLSDL